MKKKILYILIILITILVQVIIPNTVHAVDQNKQISINVEKEIQAQYAYDGNAQNYKILKSQNNYAYTLFSDRQQVDNTLNNNKLCDDENIKIIIRNGYPYKTIQELGCDTNDEAYIATQEAIIAYLEQRDINLYTSIKDGGDKIILAISNILKNVEKEISQSEDLTQIADTEVKPVTSWVRSIFFPGYVSRKYKIKSNLDIVSSSLELQGGDGVKVVDVDGREKSTFSKEDAFHVLIPEDTVQHVRLKVKSKQMDKSIYISSNTDTPEKQYLILEDTQVEVEKILTVKNGNVSNVQIKNKDNDTDNPIQGNTFEIIDTTLTNSVAKVSTDQNGEILIKSVPAGKYYIRQTETTGKYAKSNSLIDLNIDGSTPLIEVEIRSTAQTVNENILKDEKIVVTDKTNTVIDKNVTDITNIVNTNENHDKINEVNKTNLNNINYFNNTINRNNTTNLKRINTYNNIIEENNIVNRMLKSQNQDLLMTREDMINYIDLVKISDTQVPILPVACK